MEMPRWQSEMGMEDLEFIDEFQMMNTFCDITPEQSAAAFGEVNQPSFPESSPPYPTFIPLPLEPEANQACFENPTKQLKTADSGSSCTTEKVSTLEDIRISQSASVKQNYAPKACHGEEQVIAKTTKPESNSYDHVIAERKRREKLSQHFIALSGMVPGNKIDKTSVLGDTIKYLKELQERVKTFEEQRAKKTMESVVFVTKVQIVPDNDTPSNDGKSTNSSSKPHPEIVARVSDKNVLIHIHCQKQKGIFGKALNAIEELNLSVVNSRIIPIGNSSLDITVVAQMGEEFSTPAKNLLKDLRSSFCKFM